MLVLAFTGYQYGLAPLLVGVFIVNLLAATQDIATDGMAVDLLEYNERGLGNGVQVAGYRVGMILGGGALLILFDLLKWRWIFALMALMLLLATGPVWAYKEQPRAASKEPRPERVRLTTILEWLKRPGMAAWLGVLLIYKSGEAMAKGMLRPFMIDLELTLADVGWILGTLGFSAGLLGAVSGGYLVGRLGRARALVVFATLQALTVGGFLLPALGFGYISLIVTCGLEHFASGMATAALFTVMMDACRQDSEATDYTTQACAVVIATGLATTLSGFSAEHLGYAGHFTLAFSLCVVALVFLILYLKQHGAPLLRTS